MIEFVKIGQTILKIKNEKAEQQKRHEFVDLSKSKDRRVSLARNTIRNWANEIFVCATMTRCQATNVFHSCIYPAAIESD